MTDPRYEHDWSEGRDDGDGLDDDGMGVIPWVAGAVVVWALIGLAWWARS